MGTNEFVGKVRKNNTDDSYNENNVEDRFRWNNEDKNGTNASKMKTSQQDLFTSTAEVQRNG